MEANRLNNGLGYLFWPIVMTVAAGTSPAYGAAPADLLATYTTQSGSPAVPSRGQQFFTSRHGHEWSCASCHGARPTGTGTHAGTGKEIGALAPAFNPERFTDARKSDKWFRRNCSDVVGRECTASEKADILSWLMTFKR
jgi:mono/diheme cytochrome c family protein